MATFRTFSLLLLAALGAAAPARADDILIDGQDGCARLHGYWSDSTCAVQHLVVGVEDRVIVDGTVAFVVSGSLYNYGWLEVRGAFHPNGGTTNRGTMIIAGLTVNAALIMNEATLVNRGWLHNHAAVSNRGAFYNEGLLETCSGPVVNAAFMQSSGDIQNWGGSLVNFGILVNDGDAYNPDDDSYVIRNTGALENRGTIDNEGTLQNSCGAALYGSGSVTGRPPVQEPCDAASALKLLNIRLLDSERYALGTLAKKDVQLLAGHLARATKALDVDDRVGAAVWVTRFSSDVETLETAGRIAPPLAAAYRGWAAVTIALLGS